MAYKIYELRKLTVEEVRTVARELAIEGRSKMKKEELIDAIARKQYLGTPTAMPKAHYVDNAVIGVIVAFKAGDRMLSGKIEEIHASHFFIRTKNGICFNVQRENIVWVKTGDRWPKGVYLALKGITDEGQATN